jgi:hypothetical protein
MQLPVCLLTPPSSAAKYAENERRPFQGCFARDGAQSGEITLSEVQHFQFDESTNV